MQRKDQLWVLRRCGRKGHILAWLDTLEDTFQASTNDQETLLRCLRCGTFVSPEDSSVTQVFGNSKDRTSLSLVPLVLRGAHGRKLALLKLLAAERAIRALGLIIAAIAVFTLGAHRDAAIDKLNALIASAGPLANQLGWDITHSHTLELVKESLGISPGTYTLVGLALLVYAGIQLVEAFGLWGGWLWAEYLAAIATAAFIPLEIYELVNHVTVLKIGTVTLNIVIVIYLVYKGRLFGVRGGHKKWLAEIRKNTLLGEVLQEQGLDPQLQTNHKVT